VVTVDEAGHGNRDKDDGEDVDGGEEERTWGGGSSSSPSLRTKHGASHRGGDGQSSYECRRCQELQLDLDEKDLEVAQWKKRFESLAGEVRELQRALLNHKRGRPEVRAYLHQHGVDYQHPLGMPSDALDERERLDDLLR